MMFFFISFEVKVLKSLMKPLISLLLAMTCIWFNMNTK
jgi:hypothetical protein